MTRRILIALVACAALVSCTQEYESTPKLDTSPAATQHWPQGRSVPYKISDSLILAIPLEYERSALYARGGPIARAPRTGVIENAQAQFDFFLPDYTGYTPQNFEVKGDPNKVEVAYLIAANPAARTSNMLANALKTFLDPNDYRDMYGLRCYQPRILKDRVWCYGIRDDSNNEDIMLYVLEPPYSPGVVFPQMHARYISKRYGGVEIAWRTHISNFPRWHEIDAQIWKFIDTWNVAKKQTTKP